MIPPKNSRDGIQAFDNLGALSLSILGIRANSMNEVRVFDAWAVGVWRKKDTGRVTVFITGRTPPGD